MLALPILVTGATGHVGAFVVQALLARGLQVRTAARDPAQAQRALGGQVTAVALDFQEPATFPAAVSGIGGLFLMRPPAIARVGPTLNALIDCAIAAGVAHVVFLSVQGAERQRYIPHHAVEEHLRRASVAWTFLRPGFFAQNLGDAYRDDIRQRDQLVVPAGQGRVAWIDARDIAEVAAWAFGALSARGQAYALTGAEALDFAEAAVLLSAALGRPIRYVPASIAGYARHLRHWHHLPWLQIAVQTALHVGLRYGHGALSTPTVEQLLGRPPRSLADYIRDHVSLWMR